MATQANLYTLARIERTFLRADGTPYQRFKVYIAYANANNPARLFSDKDGKLEAGEGNGIIFTDDNGEIRVFVPRNGVYRVQLRHPTTDYVFETEDGVTPTLDAAKSQTNDFTPVQLDALEAIASTSWTPAQVTVLTGVASSGGLTGQPFIQFKDEGLDIGLPGQVSEIDITGVLTASVTGNKLTLHSEGVGDTNQYVSAINVSSVPLTKGQPVYFPTSGNAALAMGVGNQRHVVALYSGDTNLPPGGSGLFMTEGTLTATASEWQNVTGIPGGLITNRKYCLSTTIEGRLESPLVRNATPQNAFLVSVGYAVSSTALKLEVQPHIKIS